MGYTPGNDTYDGHFRTIEVKVKRPGGPPNPEQVRALMDYLFDHLNEANGKDGFCWADQIRSAAALREHWSQIERDFVRKYAKAMAEDDVIAQAA